MDRLLLRAFLLFAVAFCGGDATRCFECTSLRDLRCGDHFQLGAMAATECMSGTCVKYRGERWEGSIRTVEIHRGCIQQRTEGCFNSNFNGIPVHACACNLDLCNSASGLTSGLLGSLMASAVLVMKFW